MALPSSAAPSTHPDLLFYRTFEVHADRDWVVFVHGAGGSSAVWFKQLREFREAFNVLLLDLRGHGRSKEFHGDGSPYSLHSISRDIVDVLDDAGIDQAHFVGVSLGTILIRTVLDLAPERVRSVVYAGAVAGLSWWARFLIMVGHTLKHIVPFRPLYATFAWIIMPGKHAAEARRVFRREARKVEPDEFRRWLRLTKEVHRRVRSWAEAMVTRPALYLMGSLDYIFLPPARRIAALQEHASLRVIEGAGHVCNIEYPERFNEAAIGFIREHAAPVRVDSEHDPVDA